MCVCVRARVSVCLCLCACVRVCLCVSVTCEGFVVQRQLLHPSVALTQELTAHVVVPTQTVTKQHWLKT